MVLKKIHKTLITNFDSAGSALSIRICANLQYRLGNGYDSVVKAVRSSEVNSMIDEMNTIEIHNNPIIDKQIFDFFFIFDLSKMNEREDKFCPLDSQLIDAKKTLNTIVLKSMLQGFFFNVYGIFLFPAITSLDEKEKLQIWEEMGTIEKNEAAYHHAFILTPENSSIHLDYDQYAFLLESFIMFFMISPLKREIKNHIDIYRSTFDRNSFPYFSFGIALLNISNDEHRHFNFQESKNILLSEINPGKLKTPIFQIRESAAEFVKNYFSNQIQFLEIINDISIKDSLKENEIFNDSIFKFLYDYSEHMNDQDMEAIYYHFAIYLKRSLFEMMINTKMNMKYIRLVLCEVINIINDMAAEVTINSFEGRKCELLKNYYKYNWFQRIFNRSKTIFYKFKCLFSSKIPDFSMHQEDSSLVCNSISFWRKKIVDDFHEYVIRNIQKHLEMMQSELEAISDDKYHSEIQNVTYDSPFIVRLFSTKRDVNDPINEFIRIFEENRNTFTKIVKGHVESITFELSKKLTSKNPIFPHEAIRLIYQYYKEFYYGPFEKTIYREESENFVENYSEDNKFGLDLKKVLLRLSEPFISFHREWNKRPRLFYSNFSKKNLDLFETNDSFLNNRFIADAFNTNAPWEIPIFQLEGPFKLSDLKLYKLLEDDYGKSSD